MALTRIKTDSITANAITAEKISSAVDLGGPKIANVQIANSSWGVLDDTAVSVDGGYIIINGSGFVTGCSVIVDGSSAPSVSFVNSSILRVTLSSDSAGTYMVYVVNPDGGTAVGVNALTYSATPSWVTSSNLASATTNTAYNYQLEATGATSYSLQAGSALPANSTLASNGLLTGLTVVESNTNYSFTVVAIDDENQDSPRTFSLEIKAVVPAIFTITPALNGNTTWALLDADLDTGTAYGIYTLTPQGTFNAYVKMWGAGGGAGNQNDDGGAGGFSNGIVTFIQDQPYVMLVGQGGREGGLGTANGGGGSSDQYRGGGGGYSGIFFGGISQANAIIMAGGGGGAGGHGSASGYIGGAGGGTSGQNATYIGGGGGTQSAGGTAASATSAVSGSALAGGSSLSGGGGGYFGGGTGGDSGSYAGGGGGGSGRISSNTSWINGGNTYTGNYQTPANSSDANRGSAGNPALSDGAGQPGKVYIEAV